MRKLLRFLARPIVWSTGGLLLLLLALYIVCGLVGLDEKRLYVELVVGIPLALFLVVYWLRELWAERRLARELQAQARKQAKDAGPDALRDLQVLDQEFSRAFHELNQACRERGIVGGAAALPWILVMGLPGAGKSTALERAGLRFTSLGRRVQGIAGTRNCTWWLSSEAVLLDTAGRYATREEDRDEWRAFLHLLYKRRKRPIDALLVQLGVDELLDRRPEVVERTAVILRERLDDLLRGLQVQCPVHLVFNKCDLLDGFLPFFSALRDNERQEPWGFSLDVMALRGQALSNAFREGYDRLVSSLAERLPRRLLAPMELDEREAVLTFPAETAAARDTLASFTETLCEPDSNGERPWLTAVYLTSAYQTGPQLAGERHRRLGQMGVAVHGSARSGVVDTTTYFLRGVFTHIIRQAEQLARPSEAKQRRMLRTQRLAVAVSLGLCVLCSWFVGSRYSEQVDWLTRLRGNVQNLMQDHATTRRANKDELRNELKRQMAVIDTLEEDISRGLSEPKKLAGSILRKRIDDTWLAPLKTQLEQDFDQTIHRQSSDPGEEFDRGYRVLKATYILDGNQCTGTDPQDSREFLTDYLLDQWRRALGKEAALLSPREQDDVEHPQSPYGQLRRGLNFFVATDLHELPAATQLHFVDTLREQARASLVNAETESSVVFKLRASNANLYSRTAQLDAPFIADSGIEQVFTGPGCARFFRDTTRGKEWWSCVLKIPEPKESAGIEDVYQHHFIESWDRWLRELSLRNPPADTGGKPVEITAGLTSAIKSLDGLIRDPRPSIPQIIKTIGRGMEAKPDRRELQARKSGWFGCRNQTLSNTVDRTRKAYKDATMVPECQTAQDMFAPMSQLASAKEKGQEEGEGGALREDYAKYLAAVRALRLALFNLKESATNLRPTGALKMVQTTMAAPSAATPVPNGELWALDTARRSLIDSLDAQLGPRGVVIKESGLNKIMTQIESDIWSAILPSASTALDDQWRTRVIEPWTRLRERHRRANTDKTERCKQVVDFLKKDLDLFVKEVLTPLYAGNPARCELGSMQEPFAERIAIKRDRCEQVVKAWRIGQETDPEKAGGAAATKPKRDPIKVDVSLPRGRTDCGAQGEEVRYDNGAKVFVCQVHTGDCVEAQGVTTSKHARLLLKWKNESSARLLHERERPEDLTALEVNGGKDQMIFDVPADKAPGRCVGYQVRFRLAPQAGGGGPPAATDNRWDNPALLPNSLIKSGGERTP